MSEHLPDTNVGNIEYIRRQDALERFYDSISGVPASSVEHVSEYANKMMRRIQNIEPADVVPVRHGRWIKEYRAKGQVANMCTECGGETGRVSKYCSNCGAKMDGEECGHVV